MARARFCPHGADLSIYASVAVMRSVYLDCRYRNHPRCRRPRIGPLPAAEIDPSAALPSDRFDTRTTAHAIVIVPARIVLLRFARRAALADIERLELERELVCRTPELAVLREWPIEMRLVFCDRIDGIEAAARARGIKFSLYAPWLLVNWRSRGQPRPDAPMHPLNFDDVALRRCVVEHWRPAAPALSQAERTAALLDRIGNLDSEQRSARAWRRDE